MTGEPLTADEQDHALAIELLIHHLLPRPEGKAYLAAQLVTWLPVDLAEAVAEAATEYARSLSKPSNAGQALVDGWSHSVEGLTNAPTSTVRH